MEKNIENSKQDYLVAGLKSVVGMLPILGPFLQELVAILIPNQRIDRLSKFTKTLEEKLISNNLKLDNILMSNENILVLTEEAFKEAAQAVTNERREYIASLLVSGIKSEIVDSVEARHLFKILSSLNDIELVILLFYSKHRDEGQQILRKNEQIFENRISFAGAPQSQRDKHALYNSYLEHMANLGLLRKEYQWEKRGFADETRKFEKPEIRFFITDFGKLLLKSIDLHDT